MNKKRKRIFSIALDVLLVILIALILFISINALVSKNKGYTSLFGNVVYAVETDSMKGDKADSFDKNALIFCKELSLPDEKKSLKKGDVITFWFFIKGQKKLNTHRIVGIIDEGGPNCQYVTKGDKYNSTDDDTVTWSDVVAVYKSKINGLGAVVLFAQSRTGFFVIAVLPSILLFVYCAILFYSSVKKITGKKKEAESATAAAAALEAQKEEIRKQILSELASQNRQDGNKDKKEQP